MLLLPYYSNAIPLLGIISCPSIAFESNGTIDCTIDSFIIDTMSKQKTRLPIFDNFDNNNDDDNNNNNNNDDDPPPLMDAEGNIQEDMNTTVVKKGG